MVEYQPPKDWQQWVQWLAAGLHGRNRWRLAPLMMGILFASGRKTVTAWFHAAGIQLDFRGFYYFLQPVGRKSQQLAERLLVVLITRLPLGDKVLLAVDDTPTKRQGPKVQGAGIHHNPTPGTAGSKFLYGHVWVTIALIVRHPLWNTIGFPLLGLLYVRAQDLAKIPARHGWQFRTKLELATGALLRFARLLQRASKTAWVVADGAYAKRPFLKPLRAAGVAVVSRLRHDARLFDLPPPRRPGQRGRPRKYGTRRLSLARRGNHPRGWRPLECVVYGQRVEKQVKTFRATYAPAEGLIRVVIVKESRGCQYFFCTDATASARSIVEAFSDRSAIETDFHDVKEVWGAGQAQVRRIWSNVACFNLPLWLSSLVEAWSWSQPGSLLRKREASPWDAGSRRPSHADRCRALRREILEEEYKSLRGEHRLSSKIRGLYQLLLQLAT